MYKLRVSSKAKNEIKKIKLPHQKAIILALAEINEEPFLGKPLTRELTGKFFFRVGVYRIIYKVNKKPTSLRSGFFVPPCIPPSAVTIDSVSSSSLRSRFSRSWNKKDKVIDVLTAGHRAIVNE